MNKVRTIIVLVGIFWVVIIVLVILINLGGQHIKMPPSAPSDLVVTDLTATTLSLEWLDNSNDEKGFKVYRDDEIIAKISANSKYLEDVGLQPATEYKYSVSAYNKAGESSASECWVTTLNPPIAIRLEKIGVYDNGEDYFREVDLGFKLFGDYTGGEVYLGVIATDGINTTHYRLPKGKGIFFKLLDNEVKDVNLIVFSTDVVGEYLALIVTAYESDGGPQEEAIVKGLAFLSKRLLGLPTSVLLGLSEFDIKGFIAELIGMEDDYLGSYKMVWKSDEDWGVGEYTDEDSKRGEGKGDLRLWFTVECPFDLSPSANIVFY